jgi:hypothetical protein
MKRRRIQSKDQISKWRLSQKMVKCADFVAIPPRYPTDLTDDEWQLLEQLFPPVPKLGRKRRVANRDIVNAIVYIWQSGCSWRLLPHDFPSWRTVYYYYRLWHHDGTLDLLRSQLGKLRPYWSSLSREKFLSYTLHRSLMTR